MSTLEWFQVHDNLLLVARYLVDDQGVTAEELLYFFEKPWKFTDEWKQVGGADPDAES